MHIQDLTGCSQAGDPSVLLVLARRSLAVFTPSSLPVLVGSAYETNH